MLPWNKLKVGSKNGVFIPALDLKQAALEVWAAATKDGAAAYLRIAYVIRGGQLGLWVYRGPVAAPRKRARSGAKRRAARVSRKR